MKYEMYPNQAWRSYQKQSILYLMRLGLFLIACLSVSTAASAERPFAYQIRDFQVFPYDGYYGTIPFKVRGKEPFTVEVEIEGTGNIPVIEEYEKFWTDQPRTLQIEKVPIGGPYIVRFIRGAKVVEYKQILIGEIWVVGGQDNALGAVDRESRYKVNQVHLLRNNQWEVAHEPLFGSMDHHPERERLLTPWLVAAQYYYETAGIPVGLICIGSPRANMLSFWDREQVQMPRFKTLVERYGRSANVFGWQQGESDANLTGLLTYRTLLDDMARVMRNYSKNPQMKILVIQTGRYESQTGTSTPYFGLIREAQRDFCVNDDGAILIPSMHSEMSDGVHLSAAGVRKLGDQMGELLIRANSGRPHLKLGPAIERIEFTDDTRRSVLLMFDKQVRKLNLEQNAESSWLLNDDTHLGHPGANQPIVRDGIIELDLSGARFEDAQPIKDGRAVRIKLKDSGYVKVQNVKIVDNTMLILELDRPLGENPRVSYGLMNDSIGTVRDAEGRFLAAFANHPILSKSP